MELVDRTDVPTGDAAAVSELRQRLDDAFGPRLGELDRLDLANLLDPSATEYATISARYDWLPDSHDDLLETLGLHFDQ